VVYPNALVMGYLKQTGQLTPERRMELEHALNVGYQRVLTFRTEGGFDWYGQPPAKTVLTAYGILMLSDMDKVYPVDRSVIEAARSLLRGRQQPDGSWQLDREMHTWHQVGGALPLTAYVAWALIDSGAPPSATRDAVRHVEANWRSANDAYVAALAALVLATADSNQAPQALAHLESMAVRGKDDAHWTTGGQGIVYSRGNVADIEATALAALALVRGGRSTLLDGALTWLVRAKDPEGGWHSTQATILAIKALLEAAAKPRIEKPVAVALRVNGEPVDKAFETITRDNAETMQQVSIGSRLRAGDNVIELDADVDAPLTFQVASRHHLPWDRVPKPPESPVEIETRYDRTSLHVGEDLVCDVTVRFKGQASFMLIVDLGIPAGFTSRAEDLEALVTGKRIDRYTLTGRQITLYFGQVSPGQRIEFRHRLTPRFIIRTTPPPARAYEYYNPGSSAVAPPVTLEATGK